MANQLLNIFQQYLCNTYKRLQYSDNIQLALPYTVQELENEAYFGKLVLETQSAFSNDLHSKSHTKQWHDAIHHFFCRSGLYLDLANEELPDFDDTFLRYCATFEMHEAEKIYLAPLEFVHLNQRLMDFETFQLRRFTVKELEDMFQNRVNSVFYAWAAIDQESLRLLSEYWFIQVKTSESVNGIGYIRFSNSWATKLVFQGYAEREYTRYPKPIELAVSALSLFNWPRVGSWRTTPPSGIISDKEDENDMWLKFHIPFVLQINNDLLKSPDRAPNLSILHTIPNSLTHDQTNDEPLEVPERNIWLDKKQAEELSVFLEDIGGILNQMRSQNSIWKFVGVAVGSFTRAFCADPGLEQLLSYVTALEALLGEAGQGVTKRLQRRLGLILNRKQGEADKISKRFADLYQVRCDFVHGDAELRAHATDLVDIYRFSRAAVLWFLNFFRYAQDIANSHPSVSLPNRKEILRLIDQDAITKQRFNWLAIQLPKRFPFVSKWIDY